MWRRRSQDAAISLPLAVHFVGIGGIGMSALARVLRQRGHRVSGSEGVQVFIGHSPDHLGGAELVVATAAVPADNPELVEAHRRGIPVIKRADLLGMTMAQSTGIAIAGTHGKTTTTAALGYLLYKAGRDPTILVGGEMVDFEDLNARVGEGPHLVAEADEFDASFLRLAPKLAIVTNIEPEHLDFYGTFEDEVQAFVQFLQRLPPDGAAILCLDDPALRRLIEGGPPPWRAPVVTYGFHPRAQWRATEWSQGQDGAYTFTVSYNGRPLGAFALAIPGLHNVQNMLAVMAAGSQLGVGIGVIREALATFHGVRRRFEVKGTTAHGIIIVDDYAHHPTEVQATLAAARARYPDRRLVCLFQPHTYSRTKLLFQDFLTCFDAAAVVLVADIYPARERYEDWPVTAQELAAALQHPDARYVGSLDDALGAVERVLRPGDVFLTLGAGEAFRVGEAFLRRHAASGREGQP
jgi:UDP-N-acetylmuramate--alanine ligase